MEGVARVWEALDKLSVENPEEYKQASVIANFVIALMTLCLRNWINRWLRSLGNG